MFQSSSYAIFFIGKRDVGGCGANLWCCILHGYTHACQFQHAQVVVAISESNHIGWGEIDFRQKAEQGLSLVDAFRNQLQEEWGGAEYVHPVAQNL